jgi:hypothetical protein
MTKQIALAAALCALAGCTVPMHTVEASRTACASYGFQSGSDEFAHCVMTEQNRHTLYWPAGAGVIAQAPALPPLPGAPPPVQAPMIAMPPLPQPQLLVPAGGGAFMALP